MRRIETPPGTVFGRLTVLSEILPTIDGKRKLRLTCACGNIAEVTLGNLRNGHIRSCGCLLSSTLKLRNAQLAIHNMSQTSEHRTWMEIRQRCSRESHKSFKHYGAKGISVCERWLTFENFYADMGPKPSHRHSIERLNNFEGYCPSNCVWATAAQQSRNKSTNVFVEYNGARMVAFDAARLSGVPYQTLYKRIHEGITGIDLFKLPNFRKKKT